ncbi:protein ATP6V1FNB-like [Argonauta hians]
MARTNFAEIKSLEESFKKEQSLRLAWHQRRQEELLSGKPTQKPQASDNLRKKLLAEGDATFKKVPVKLKRKEAKIQMEEPVDLSPIELMRPIDQDTKDLLYDGISRDGKGRVKYLKQRYLEDPENKFSFPVTSGMEYGWNIGELVKNFNIGKSIHGRRCILRDTFYRRNGIVMKPGP